MTSSVLLCNNSPSVIDQLKFITEPVDDARGIKYTIYIFFISILIMTKPVGLFGGRKKSITLFCSSMWHYFYRLIKPPRVCWLNGGKESSHIRISHPVEVILDGVTQSMYKLQNTTKRGVNE